MEDKNNGAAAKGSNVNRPKRWAMVIDLHKCVGCHTCAVACKSENNVPLGFWRSWVKGIQKGAYPDVKDHYLPRLCNNCDIAPCVKVCPVRATVRRPDGIVTIYFGKCIGCGLCIAACPYDARFINPIRHTADKCTFCQQRVDKGLLPACVTSCIGRARTFGDLNDPHSVVSRIVAKHSVQVLKKELGTRPMVYYIGADRDIQGRIKISDKYPEAIEEYPGTIPSRHGSYWKNGRKKGEG
jgi:tetrathionate reductase subunit B